MASIQKRNDKWQARVRRQGHSPRSKSFASRADAQRWVRQVEQELDRSGLAYDPSQLERTTVADLLTRYRAEITPKKRGWIAEDSRLEVFLREPWVGLPLSRVTPQTFTQFRDRRLTQVSPGTVIRELGLLRAVFELARREWDIPLHENPLARIRKPKAAKGRERRLRPLEQNSLLEAARQARSGWLVHGITLAIETGMRRGELLNIRAEHIDIEKRLLRIPETKTDVPRTIPLTGRALTVLRQLMDEQSDTGERLFPVSANAFQLAWERCRQRAAHAIEGIDDLRFHDR